MSAITIDQMVQMSRPELDGLYRSAGAGPAPAGAVRGTALFPDASLALTRSRLARAVWQGKVFHPDGSGAVNRFFGVRMIRAEVYPGSSWMDGGPALILDYSRTSRIYGRYRDEIRQVAPGLYLGAMYDRTTPTPTFTRYFALQSQPR
jgi:hypothetical protein